MDFGEAFGVEGSKYPVDMVSTSHPSAIRPASYDEEIHLAPYPYTEIHNADSTRPIVR